MPSMQYLSVSFCWYCYLCRWRNILRYINTNIFISETWIYTQESSKLSGSHLLLKLWYVLSALVYFWELPYFYYTIQILLKSHEKKDLVQILWWSDNPLDIFTFLEEKTFPYKSIYFLNKRRFNFHMERWCLTNWIMSVRNYF